MARFFYFYFTGDGAGDVQSVIVAGVLLTAGMPSFILAVFSDIMRINRKLIQEALSELRTHVCGARSDQNLTPCVPLERLQIRPYTGPRCRETGGVY